MQAGEDYLTALKISMNVQNALHVSIKQLAVTLPAVTGALAQQDIEAGDVLKRSTNVKKAFHV